MKALRLILVLLAAAALAAAAYFWLGRPLAVETAEVTRGPAIEAVYATGVVEPVNWAKVTPLVRGQIVEICRCEGAKVQKGAVLAKLDDREPLAQLAELQARERFLAQEAERYRQLVERSTASLQAYERALSERAQAVAAIAAARERLSWYTLRAPIDGQVLLRDGEIGEVAEIGRVLFWVGPPTPLWAVADFDEEDIPRVRLGQEALLRADAFPGQALAGEVRQITPKGDPVNKTYRVYVGLPPETPLMIGMTTEINVVVRRVPDALLAPARGVVAGRAWVVRDGEAEPRQVETGVAGPERVQVLSGLEAGERVVLDPPESLREGARVRPKD